MYHEHRRRSDETFDKLQHFPDCGCVSCIENAAQARIGIHPFPDKLYVVTMLENPLRWRSRYANYNAFEVMCAAGGAKLYTAEIAYGDRHFEITEAGNPRHLQLRTEQNNWQYEFWHKENTLNLLIARLPSDWKYVAWIDADVMFARPDWAQETLHLLQHYRVLQMFSHTQDLGPNGEPLGTSYGYVSKRDELPPHRTGDYYYYYAAKGMWIHPGFAWAARRDALNDLGGLIDWAILGSGDWLMAAALFGDVDRALSAGYSETYKAYARIWQARAELHIKRNVGHMSGLVLHSWHGRKIDRNYDTRWRLLVDQKFDPETNLKKDVQGLWTLSDPSIALRDGIRHYARLRDEDTKETK